MILVRFQIVNMDSSDIFQDTGPDGGVEEYEEELTAAEVLQKLEDAWLNEKHSPELLEPKMEIVECMLEQVKSLFIIVFNGKISNIFTIVLNIELIRLTP